MTSVHRRVVRAAAAPLVAALALALPAGAEAARVLVMGPAGHVTARQDPFVPAAEPTSAPTTVPATAAAAKPTKARKPPQKTVASELTRLRNSGAITPAQYATYNSSLNAALGYAAVSGKPAVHVLKCEDCRSIVSTPLSGFA